MIILNDLKWPTLEKRRKVTRLTTMFKVVTSLSAIQVTHSFKLMLKKKNKFQHSFTASTIRDWN